MEKTLMGKTAEGVAIDAYTLRSSAGIAVTIMTFGAIITQWQVPDAAGKPGNIVLGFEQLADYEKPGPYFGAVCGRVANRIAGGKFTLDGRSYTLPTGKGPHHLHGGIRGYDRRVWSAEAHEMPDAQALQLSLTDPEGTEGYPGTVRTSVTYTLRGNTLEMEYTATTDKPTPINLTNHSYFNLKDAGRSDVLGHILQLDADQYTQVDESLIPSGQIMPVQGTALDFTRPKPLGRDIAAIGGNMAGYDHNFIVRRAAGASLVRAAVVEEPASGRRMEVWTTQPGIQLYTANFLDGTLKGPGGIVYRKYHAFCLETQHYPDSVHHPHFPSTILRPGETYRQVTEFRSSTGHAGR